MKTVLTVRRHRVGAWPLIGSLVLSVSACGSDSDTDDGGTLPPPAEKLVVAWTTDSGNGALGTMTMRSPWRFEGPSLPIGASAVLRCGAGNLYVVSHAEGTVSIVDLETHQAQIIASLGAWEAKDIAVIDADTAYLTRATATHLLRLDIASGATTDVVDLGQFADDDGIPDLGMMAVHDGRLFVQIRRLATGLQAGAAASPLIAVIDTATEQLIDTEPDVPGIQAIKLVGTAPKLKMQVMAETGELFVSASGGLHDHGGIELIDLHSLRSTGLVVSEATDEIGADLGSFVMVTPEEGFLVSSTDVIVSSHLQRFSLDGGVEPPPDLYQSVGYEAPSIELDRGRKTLFFPNGQPDKRGIMVLDVATGAQLIAEPVSVNGVPTDILADCSTDL